MVAHRPDVVGRDSIHSVKPVCDTPWVGVGDNTPTLAVPMHSERLDIACVAVVPDCPNIIWRYSCYREEFIVVAAQAGRVDQAPLRPVPAHRQGLRGATSRPERPDKPYICGRTGRQAIYISTGAGWAGISDYAPL